MFDSEIPVIITPEMSGALNLWCTRYAEVSALPLSGTEQQNQIRLTESFALLGTAAAILGELRAAVMRAGRPLPRRQPPAGQPPPWFADNHGTAQDPRALTSLRDLQATLEQTGGRPTFTPSPANGDADPEIP